MADTKFQDPPGFETLSKAEQVRYVQELWDRILASPGEIPVLESQLELVESRIEQLRREPASTRPAHELLDQLSQGKK